ncbi:MAG: prefoldin subunit alpha [Candidatus Hodarchaeales archaeon]|jgi:prefoldin alpha subunit
MSNASFPQDNAQAALNRKVQAQVLEIQEMEKTINALQNSIEMLAMQRRELLGSKETLEMMKQREKGERVMVPLGQMLLVPFLLSGEDHTLFRSGSNVLIPMNITTAIGKLDEQVQSMENLIQQTNARVNAIFNQMQQKEAELNSMIQTVQK